MPLGIESGQIEDQRITASSTASSWYYGPWQPHLARLNRQGAINAWQARVRTLIRAKDVKLSVLELRCITEASRRTHAVVPHCINLCMCLSLPQYNDMNQWLQVELPHIKKITGIITQGAKSLGTEMYVISYSLQYSDSGMHWQHYTEDEVLEYKVSSPVRRRFFFFHSAEAAS